MKIYSTNINGKWRPYVVQNGQNTYNIYSTVKSDNEYYANKNNVSFMILNISKKEEYSVTEGDTIIAHETTIDGDDCICLQPQCDESMSINTHKKGIIISIDAVYNKFGSGCIADSYSTNTGICMDNLLVYGSYKYKDKLACDGLFYHIKHDQYLDGSLNDFTGIMKIDGKKCIPIYGVLVKDGVKYVGTFHYD